MRLTLFTRLFRISSLVLPSWAAWYVAFSFRHPTQLQEIVLHVLGPMWMLLAGAMFLRATALAVRRRTPGTPGFLERLDVLTSRGTALAWTSALAIGAAVHFGFASLAVVGLLGTGLLHLVLLHAFVAYRGADPMNLRTITRRFSPETVTEGADLVEEIRFGQVRVPLGFRMFVTGRIGPRWAECRHVVAASESGGELLLTSEVGPAVRGDHTPEPLALWFEDSFGLTHSPGGAVGGERLVVKPLERTALKAAPLLDQGIGPNEPKRAFRMPTEGLFALREYQRGDDIRRIHWIRSLVSGEIVVRMPDELPPDRPRIRLVLDTYFPGVEAFDCDAPSEMLDALVRTWFAVGHALAEDGARVTMVCAMSNGSQVEVLRRDLTMRALEPVLAMGASVAWQDRVPVDRILTGESTFVVSRGMSVVPPETGNARWILVVPEIASPPSPIGSFLRVPFHAGSTENRWRLRRRIDKRRIASHVDHRRAVLVMRANVAPPPPGSFLATTKEGGSIVLEAIQ